MNQQIRVLRKPELRRKIGLSDASVWRLERADKFPRRILLGGNSVGWIEGEINNWILAKAEDRNGDKK